MVRGTMKYIPKDVMEEINRLKFEFNIQDEGECLRKLARRSNMIRDLKFNLDVNIKRGKK